MIKLLSIQEIKNSIHNIRPQHIIKHTGLSRTTINNLYKGKNKNYKITTILKITQYIESLNNKENFFNN